MTRSSPDKEELVILSFLDHQVFAPGGCSNEAWRRLTARLSQERIAPHTRYTLFEERVLPAVALEQMSEEQLLTWSRQVPAILNEWRQGGCSHILVVLPGEVALAVTVLACVYGALHVFPPCILLDEQDRLHLLLLPARMSAAGAMLKMCQPSGTRRPLEAVGSA